MNKEQIKSDVYYKATKEFEWTDKKVKENT